MKDFVATHHYVQTGNGDEIIAVPLSEDERQAIREEHKRSAQLQAKLKLDEVASSVSPLMWDAMSEAQRDVWRAYRQALMDVPQQPGFPYDIQWPTKPE